MLLGKKKEKKKVYLSGKVNFLKSHFPDKKRGKGDFAPPLLSAISTVYDCSRLIGEFASLWKL